MSIRRMTLGAGYRYLMSSVARMDAGGPAKGLIGYYAAQGTPPGRFLGAGLAGLGGGIGVPSGSPVSEEQLWRMLGMLQDPLTGQSLGRPPTGPRAHFIDRLGRVRRPPKTVAGFDLTFSVPKSVSVAWALADEPTRERIRAAHEKALEFVIGYAEEQVFATRLGSGGVVCDDTRGVVAAAFEHWDSRAGDPQLHTHVVVLNRVQAVSDGGWRTLDSKALFRSAVGLSELYNGVLSDYLTADLGWGWAPGPRRRSAEPKWEVDGVAAALRDEFSRRSCAIEDVKDRLVEAFAADHGRQPTAREVIQLRQQATLATRPDKHVTPLRDLIVGWRRRAETHVGTEQTSWVASLAGRNDLPLLGAADLAPGMLYEVAAVALDKVSAKRATFTRANILAEVLRQLHGVRFADPADRAAVAERTAAWALEGAVMLTPPEIGIVPDGFRRADGSSMFRPRDAEVYATQDLLDAEERLLAAARSVAGPVVDPALAQAVTAQDLPGRRHRLSVEQADAVCAVVASGRPLDVLVGAAGTGKSTAMAGVRAAWEAAHGPGSVVGLAPSAAAAEVLADAVGIPTENTAKWLTEAARQPDRLRQLRELQGRLNRASPSLANRRLQHAARTTLGEYDRWGLRAGRLVIVDEASMAATRDLDQITTMAVAAGAKVLLVGDWAQLSPVTAGGAFKLVAQDRDNTPQLHDVRRFRHEWEREASLDLRDGKQGIADTYAEHGRVEGGDRESMLDLLFDAWLADTTAGRRSLMLAPDADTVADLNARARAHLVATGAVHREGVTLADRSTVGVGDRVVTRHNQRDLTSAGRWVKNGDEWIVQKVHPDGSVRVRRPVGGATALLPAGYVAEHLELGYATTAHRAQGRTVDTAHAFVTEAALLEPLYVMATRGRDSNRLYVDTAYGQDLATSHETPQHVIPVEVLRAVLATSGADVSATETRIDEELRANSPTRLGAQGAVIAARLLSRTSDLPPAGSSVESVVRPELAI